MKRRGYWRERPTPPTPEITFPEPIRDQLHRQLANCCSLAEAIGDLEFHLYARPTPNPLVSSELTQAVSNSDALRLFLYRELADKADYTFVFS